MVDDAIMRGLMNYLSGRLPAWWLGWAVFPLSIFALGGGLWLALREFPGRTDLKQCVMCQIASSSRNPEGYRYLAFTLQFEALLLMPLPGWFYRSFAAHRRRRLGGLALLWLGLIGLLLVGLERAFIPWMGSRYSPAHYLSAISGFTGLWLGMAVMLTTASPRKLGERQGPWRPSILQMAFAAPMVIVGLSWFLIEVSPPFHAWVRAAWPKDLAWLRSFAFWQWVMVASLYLGMCVGIWKARGAMVNRTRINT